jgi:hypothetical protein
LLPSVSCIANKDAQERRPARILDALGERVVPDHAGRLQVFEVNGVVLLYQLTSFLVMEVLPLAFDLLVCSGKKLDRLRAAIAPPRAPGDAPLAAAQIRLGPAIVAWAEDHCAIRQRGKGL